MGNRGSLGEGLWLSSIVQEPLDSKDRESNHLISNAINGSILQDLRQCGTSL